MQIIYSFNRGDLPVFIGQQLDVFIDLQANPVNLNILKMVRFGYLGIDVYVEANLFFEYLSLVILQDDIFARLLTFSNVLITGHQAFFISNALHNIAEITLQNLNDLESKGKSPNEVNGL